MHLPTVSDFPVNESYHTIFEIQFIFVCVKIYSFVPRCVKFTHSVDIPNFKVYVLE